ncbi:MAG TPA: putative DNA-binding protein [Pseudogracilibacillus sp.]|nr:putative DNA-binding protein [Pseudogracilibacillus sp.]
MLENTTKINMLYDFYSPLLTNKQTTYIDMYHREDYSLGEISELMEVSRQAVYDTIRRTEKALVSYEEKLGLYDKFKRRQSLLESLETEISNQTSDHITQLIDAIKKID